MIRHSQWVPLHRHKAGKTVSPLLTPGLIHGMQRAKTVIACPNLTVEFHMILQSY